MIKGKVKEYAKQFNEAEKLFLKALKCSEKDDDLQVKMKIASGLSEFYTTVGKNDLALFYYKQEIQFRDSMYNEEDTKKTVELEMNYEFEKKQAALKFENDKVVYQLEAENKLQKQWRIFFIIMIVLALMGVIFFKRAYDNKKKLASFLEAEDQRKDLLLREIHHRINNNLQIISSLLTLQANNVNNDKLSEYLLQSQNRIQSLSILHELLYEKNTTLRINMNEYINKILIYHRSVLSSMQQKIEIEEHIDDVVFSSKQAVPVALIVNELVTNCIKYAFIGKNEGLIKVILKLNHENSECVVTVSDNGNGIPEESQKRQESLGLKLVSILTRQLRGTVNSKNNNGANISINFKATSN